MNRLSLDVPTTFTVLLILGLLQALGMWIALRTRGGGRLTLSQRLWIQANLAASVMSLVISLRVQPAALHNLLLSHSMMLVWMALSWCSLRLERGLGLSWAGVGAVMLGSLSVYALGLRTLGESAMTGYGPFIALAGTSLVAWQALALSRTENSAGARLAALAFGLTALALLLRLIRVLTESAPVTSLTPAPSQLLMALGGISVFVLGNLGFLGLQIERQIRDRLQAERLRTRAEERSLQAQERVGLLQSLVDERDLLIQRLQRLDAAQQQALLAAALPHELRQPLAALRLNIDSLAGMWAAKDGMPRELLAALNQDVQRLSAMVDEFMALLQPAGEDGWPPAGGPIDAAAVARASLEAVKPRADVCGVSLSLQGPDALLVNCCPDSLSHVLLILLGNALDAVAAEPAPRRVEIAMSGGAGQAVRLQVRDNGPGVAEHLRPHLFQAFASAKPAGLGIGLALARRLATRCQAELSLEGEAEAGAQRPGAVFCLQWSDRMPAEGAA